MTLPGPAVRRVENKPAPAPAAKAAAPEKAPVAAERVTAEAGVQGARRTVSRGVERAVADRLNACVPDRANTPGQPRPRGHRRHANASAHARAAGQDGFSAGVQGVPGQTGGQTDEVASNAAAQKLRDLSNKNSDPAYVNALLRESSPTLDKIAETAGRNAAEGGGSDNDKDRMKDSLRAPLRGGQGGPRGCVFCGGQAGLQGPQQR